MNSFSSKKRIPIKINGSEIIKKINQLVYVLNINVNPNPSIKKMIAADNGFLQVKISINTKINVGIM